jgi:hypothetical protein
MASQLKPKINNPNLIKYKKKTEPKSQDEEIITKIKTEKSNHLIRIINRLESEKNSVLDSLKKRKKENHLLKQNETKLETKTKNLKSWTFQKAKKAG